MDFLSAILPNAERIVTLASAIAALVKTFHVSHQIKQTDQAVVDVKVHINSRMDQLIELNRSQAEAAGKLAGHKEEREETAKAVALIAEAEKKS